jgi:hypothetical protein
MVVWTQFKRRITWTAFQSVPHRVRRPDELRRSAIPLSECPLALSRETRGTISAIANTSRSRRLVAAFRAPLKRESRLSVGLDGRFLRLRRLIETQRESIMLIGIMKMSTNLAYFTASLSPPRETQSLHHGSVVIRLDILLPSYAKSVLYR